VKKFMIHVENVFSSLRIPGFEYRRPKRPRGANQEILGFLPGDKAANRDVSHSRPSSA
jgi:hypothetical protein